MSRRDAGITLVEVAAAVTLLGIVVALLVPSIARSSRFQKVLACEANLHTLHSAQAKDYKMGMKERGQEYWTRLTTQTPRQVSPDALRCPLVTDAAAPPCHYLGPVADPSKLEDKDPIGCDLEHNHSDDGKEGGNVLLKSGEVVTDRTGLWNSAARQGKCRP